MARNTEVIFSSAARTSTANSNSITTDAVYKGAIFYLNITAASGTAPTLDVKIQAADPAGNFIDLTSASFAQKTTTGQDYLTVYPGVAETANETVSDVIPGTFRAVATIGGTTPSFTFTLHAELIP